MINLLLFRIKKERELAPLRQTDLSELQAALEKKDSEVVLLREKSASDLRNLASSHEKLNFVLSTREAQLAELAEAREKAEREKEELNAEITRLKEQYNEEEISGLRAALARSLERERELVTNQKNVEKSEEGDDEKNELKDKLEKALAQISDILFFFLFFLHFHSFLCFVIGNYFYLTLNRDGDKTKTNRQESHSINGIVRQNQFRVTSMLLYYNFYY